MEKIKTKIPDEIIPKEVKCTVRITRPNYDKYRAYCTKNGISLARLIRYALESLEKNMN